MQYLTALVALTTILSLATSLMAFLITPGIADAATQASDPFKSLVFGRAHTIDVACQECPFFVAEELNLEGTAISRQAEMGSANTLHFDVTTNEVGLQINNVTVYPFDAIRAAVFAHQTRLDDNTQGIEVPLDFAAAMRPPIHDDIETLKHAAGQDEHELIPIDFAVTAISAVPVSVQSIHIDLMHNLVDNTYAIARVAEGTFTPEIPVDPCAGRAAYSACRLRHSVEQQLEEMLAAAKGRASGVKDWLKTDPLRSVGRPCHGKHGKHGAFQGLSDGPRHHIKGGPKHLGHHGHHGHHHRSQAMRVLRAIHTAIQFVIIPALLGIAVGLTASAIGMLVGQTVAYCWARFGRGGRRGSVANTRVYEVEIAADEKEGLLILREEPPQYRDDVEAKAEA